MAKDIDARVQEQADADGAANAVLRKHDGLKEAIAPLATLARLNPHLMESIIQLAMIYGIHASEAKRAREESYASIEREPRSLPFGGFHSGFISGRY